MADAITDASAPVTPPQAAAAQPKTPSRGGDIVARLKKCVIDVEAPLWDVREIQRLVRILPDNIDGVAHVGSRFKRLTVATPDRGSSRLSMASTPGSPSTPSGTVQVTSMGASGFYSKFLDPSKNTEHKANKEIAKETMAMAAQRALVDFAGRLPIGRYDCMLNDHLPPDRHGFCKIPLVLTDEEGETKRVWLYLHVLSWVVDNLSHGSDSNIPKLPMGHLCGEKMCMNPAHVIPETNRVRLARETCLGGRVLVECKNCPTSGRGNGFANLCIGYWRGDTTRECLKNEFNPPHWHERVKPGQVCRLSRKPLTRKKLVVPNPEESHCLGANVPFSCATCRTRSFANFCTCGGLGSGKVHGPHPLLLEALKKDGAEGISINPLPYPSEDV